MCGYGAYGVDTSVVYICVWFVDVCVCSVYMYVCGVCMWGVYVWDVV